MNILFSSDDNYAQHLGVAIYSLLENNKDVDKVDIYVVDNEIGELNKMRLSLVVEVFNNARIIYIDFKQWKEQLCLNMSWQISISAYARLFLASMLPLDVSRVIYLDCDMLVCDSLSLLWNYDMRNNVVAAVQDTVSYAKHAVGMSNEDPYFNSGLLLVDVDKWRQQDCEKRCVEFINQRNGQVVHHDQGVLNGVFRNQWTRLPLKYNLMTNHFMISQKAVKKYFKDFAPFYTETEVKQAKSHPAILHFTPSFTTRPWVKTCEHPLRHLYWETVKQTPWKEAQPEPDKNKWYVRLINWWYRNTL